MFAHADPIRALERYTGFEPVHSAWKADVLTVEHQYRIGQFFNSAEIEKTAVVPVTRFELVRGLASTDFKSVASACSAIPAYTRLLSSVGLEPTKIFVTEKIYYPDIR